MSRNPFFILTVFPIEPEPFVVEKIEFSAKMSLEGLLISSSIIDGLYIILSSSKAVIADLFFPDRSYRIFYIISYTVGAS